VRSESVRGRERKETCGGVESPLVDSGQNLGLLMSTPNKVSAHSPSSPRSEGMIFPLHFSLMKPPYWLSVRLPSVALGQRPAVWRN
jgi:hypothetical protein